jgi:LytS/YehU family sensor histidine kinase
VLVGAVVAFDASLVEVVAVRAGLWSWAEPGHLDVPVIGMLGWGYFAVGASVALSLASRWRYLGVLLLGLLTTHGLILLTWWGLFRWTLRGDLGHASTVGMLVLGVITAMFVLHARRRGRGMPMQVAGPRMLAATLFLALLLLTAPREMPYWWHVMALSVPYVASIRAGSPVRVLPST